MKKLFAVIAAFSMMIFVSCGDNGETAVSDDNVKVDENQETDEETVNDTAVDETEDFDNETTEETDNEAPDEADDIQITDDDGIITETCSTEGSKRFGLTPCGKDNKGVFRQDCMAGFWTDSTDCLDFNGTYAQKMWFTAKSKVATIDMAEAWTRTYFVVNQVQEKDKLHITAKICNIKIDNSASGTLKLNMLQSFADALPLLPKESELIMKDDGTIEFTQGTSWEIRSIDPACYGDKPGDYTLPDKETDLCVQDWDNDTIPGLKVVATGLMNGDVHIVEKSSSEFKNGWFAADGQTAGGDIFWTDVQEVVKTTNSLLKSGAQNSWKEVSDKFTGSANFFEQFKIPDGSDCTYVVTNVATIFNPDPVNIDD